MTERQPLYSKQQQQHPQHQQPQPTYYSVNVQPQQQQQAKSFCCQCEQVLFLSLSLSLLLQSHHSTYDDKKTQPIQSNQRMIMWRGNAYCGSVCLQAHQRRLCRNALIGVVLGVVVGLIVYLVYTYGFSK